jgi:hypothetical protein
VPPGAPPPRSGGFRSRKDGARRRQPHCFTASAAAKSTRPKRLTLGGWLPCAMLQARASSRWRATTRAGESRIQLYPADASLLAASTRAASPPRLQHRALLAQEVANTVRADVRKTFRGFGRGASQQLTGNAPPYLGILLTDPHATSAVIHWSERSERKPKPHCYRTCPTHASDRARCV